jgi:hypothetical protein
MDGEGNACKCNEYREKTCNEKVSKDKALENNEYIDKA